MITLYIAGPIKGQPQGNRPSFMLAHELLEEKGYGVLNPHCNGLPRGLSWEEYMAADIPMVCRSNGVALLDGWANSEGARWEMKIAKRLQKPVHNLRYWLEQDVAK